MPTKNFINTAFLRQRASTLLIFILVSLMFAGCFKINLFEQREVDYFEELGNLHLTVLPPLHFNEYRKSIQPTFKMTAKKALEEVVPVTMKHQKHGFSGRIASAAISLPTITKSITETKTLRNETLEQSKITEKKKDSGSIEGPPDLDVKGRVLQQGDTSQDNNLGIDPFMKYWTAAALYQEVQLINRNFDMAFGEDYDPYIVRLKISMLSKVRNAPYDATIDLSFFIVEKKSKDGSNEEEKNKASEIIQIEAPRIIPMLVTDNLESQLSTLSVEEVKQLALALQGMVKGIGVKSLTEGYKQLFRSVLGRDFNTLFTVGRISDNTLRVRLGAVQQAGSAYAMVSRNHTMSTVVLVPKKKNKKGNRQEKENEKFIHVTSKSRFNHAISGDELLSKYSDDSDHDSVYKEKIKKALRKYDLDIDTKVERLIGAYFNNDIGAFVKIIKGDNFVDDKVYTHLQLLWTDIADIFSSSAYDVSSAALPPVLNRINISIDPTESKEALTLFDNGEKMTVTIRNVGKPNASRISAILDVGDGSDIISFTDNDVSTDQSGTGLIISFPSLDVWGASKKMTRKLSLYWVNDDGKYWLNDDGKKGVLGSFTNISYQRTKTIDKPKAKISLDNGNKYVALLHDATGKLWLSFTNIDPSYEEFYLVISGARVAEIQHQAIIEDVDGKRKVIKDGAITVSLEGLVPGQKIKVSGITDKGLEHDPIEVEVKASK